MSGRSSITLAFQSYWCAGTGGGRGRHLDAVCHRDNAGFPAMPMTEVKGTLREAAERLAETGAAGWSPKIVNELFGERTEDGGAGGEGALEFVGDARMAGADRGLAGLSRRPGTLFIRIAATRIDSNGVALDRSLRFVECAVPVRLHGSICILEGRAAPANWIALLDAAAAAMTALGKLKNDGNGRVLASVSEDSAHRPDSAAHGGLSETLAKAGKALVILRQHRLAIFSARGATEAGHKTLEAPTGAALLGWCAQTGPYDGFTDPFAVFHSGALSFGTALPLSQSGARSIPFPRNLFAPKGSDGMRDGFLDTQEISIGAPVGDDHTQYEALKKTFLTSNPAGLSHVCAGKGQRLRTATKDGRAAKGQLFGFQHLSGKDGSLYVAEISRDETISDDDWNRVLSCFHRKILRLGRSKGNSFGGGFECMVTAADDNGFEPEKPVDRVQVLALSDLALLDSMGAATCHPTASMLGLPETMPLNIRDSVISQRRHAPWNGQLRRRDIERQVIEAGSVLSFDVPHGMDTAAIEVGLRRAGIWREVGYGKIWVNPAFLASAKLAAFDAGQIESLATLFPGEADAGNTGSADAALGAWWGWRHSNTAQREEEARP